MKPAVIAIALACAGVAPSGARAADVRGYLDCRLVAHAQERSWVDGGLGKTRFGSGGTSLGCVQAGLVVAAQPLPSLLAVAGLQAQTSGRDELVLLEAYLRWRPVSITPWRWSLKAGAFFPPVSLENDAIGWTSPWTLSSSAINAWIGEEFRTIGGEARLEWRGEGQSLEAEAGLVRPSRPAGEVLDARGLSIGDLVSGFGSDLREPDAYAREDGHEPPLRFNPFLENDGRPGWYAGLDWRAPGRGRLALLRYDNEADASTHSRGVEPVYSWRTEFWSLGGELEAGSWLLLAQAMTGSTELAPSPHFHTWTDFRAGYLLAGWNRGTWRPAFRIDAFSTNQLPRDLDDRTREHGHALTFALNWRPQDWLRLTAELLRVDSWRNQREADGDPAHRVDHQVQVGARVMF
jgi:hypothetical protein